VIVMGRPLFPDVVVNGRSIAPEQIGQEAQNHPAPPDKPGWAWRKAARALVVRDLLLEEARRRDLEAAPRQIGPKRHETEEEALIRQLLEAAVTPPAPTEDAIRRAYAVDGGRFRAPTLYEASHILIAADPADAAASGAAEAKARAVLDQLRAGGVRFESLAREVSDCASRDNGGRLGQFCAGEMAPAFEAALDGGEPGQLVDAPVATPFGGHVSRLDARAEGASPPLEAVRDRIAEALEKAAWARDARRFVGDLVDAAEIAGVEFDAAL
jgi:peptidyl-prolyl cis-trans isomerase C